MELAVRHLLLDLWLDDPALLERVELWQELLLSAARDSGATILTHHFHQFSPAGVTGFLLLAESHLSVHTWPETGLAAIDIFTCGAMDPGVIIAHLRRRLHPCRERLTWVKRGELE